MTVYVKEYKDKISVESVKQWTKSDVTVLPFNENEEHELNDIVLFSHEDDSVSEEYTKHFNYYYFEDITEKIMKNVIKDFKDFYHYGYYYLLYEFSRLKDNPNIDTIFAGSSYGLRGLDYSLIKERAINVSMHSQDLYYAMECVYSAYNMRPDIKNIVLCFSYYCFNIDISKTQNENEMLMVSEIYQPLFYDTHNAAYVNARNSMLCNSSIFDIERIHKIFVNSKFLGGAIIMSHI